MAIKPIKPHIIFLHELRKQENQDRQGEKKGKAKEGQRVLRERGKDKKQRKQRRAGNKQFFHNFASFAIYIINSVLYFALKQKKLLFFRYYCFSN